MCVGPLPDSSRCPLRCPLCWIFLRSATRKAQYQLLPQTSISASALQSMYLILPTMQSRTPTSLRGFTLSLRRIGCGGSSFTLPLAPSLRAAPRPWAQQKGLAGTVPRPLPLAVFFSFAVP